MDAFMRGFCAALYFGDACMAADFLKLPNAMFHNGAMRVNNSHAETRNMIEAFQAAYAKLGPFCHDVQVFHQAAETDTRTAVSLETDFFAPDDTALGKAKCDFGSSKQRWGRKLRCLRSSPHCYPRMSSKISSLVRTGSQGKQPLISKGILLIRALVKASEQMRT